MKAIIGGRGTGRTWKLLQEASNENGLVVCYNRKSAIYTIDMAIEMYRKGDLKIVPEIIWVSKLIGDESNKNGKKERYEHNKKIFIDNVENALEEMFHGDIGKFVVWNDEDEDVSKLEEKGFVGNLDGVDIYSFT